MDGVVKTTLMPFQFPGNSSDEAKSEFKKRFEHVPGILLKARRITI